MLNEIMDAVTRQLDALFPEYPIHTDEVKQGLTEPCFFVGILEPSQKQVIGQRYYCQNSMYIQFLPDDKADKSSRVINTVADLLTGGMEYLPTEDGLLHGTNIRSSREAGVLTVFVDYNFYRVREKEQLPSMGEINAEIRRGE